jgi:hypothetical protein
VSKELERRRPQARGVVDEHIEIAEVPGDLERHGVDIFLAPKIADDTAGACFPGDLLHELGPTGNERDPNATRGKIPDQRQSEA